MKITPLGDSALIVRLGDPSSASSRETLATVLRMQKTIEGASIPGVIECVAAYTTVAVFFDPATNGEITFALMEEKVRDAFEKSKRSQSGAAPSSRHRIPVCCDSEFALDLVSVAESSGLLPEDVMTLFCATEFSVACIGFTPGFPYLTGLPRKLATPRRSVPRPQLAAGAVAIGGDQAGIYPMVSPGGWNVVGRTPLTLFSPEKNPPSLLKAGDRVRFQQVSRVEFDRLTKQFSEAL